MKKPHKLLYPSSVLRSARDWHVYHVYNDPEFIQDASDIDYLFIITHPDKYEGDYNATSKLYEHIKEKYALTDTELDFYVYFNGINVDTRGAVPPTKRYSLFHDPHAQELHATIELRITRNEFQEIWEDIKVRQRVYRTSVTKRKSPQETRLIYAVFRARPSRKFREIFELYQNGKLAGYTGSKTQFKDEESLERYYNKYRPDRAENYRSLKHIA